MKKISVFVLVVLLTACSGGESGGKTQDKPAAKQPVPSNDRAAKAYSDYVKRAMFSEAYYGVASAAKVAVSEAYVSSGRMPKDNAEAGLDAPEKMIVKDRVVKVVVTNGVVEIHTGGNLPRGIITLTPQPLGSGSVAWTCRVTNNLAVHAGRTCH